MSDVHFTHDSQHVDLFGTQTFVQRWTPQHEPRGVIVLVHGLSEHSTRYRPLVDDFLAGGFVVTAFDLPGHGQTKGRRGHVPKYDNLMDRIEWLVDYARESYSQLPIVVYGHSWGGSLVLNFAIRRQPSIAAIVASAPALKIAFQPPRLKVALGKVLYRVWPSLTIPKQTDHARLTRNAEARQAFIDDPLVHDMISSRLAVDLFNSGLWALEHAAELSIPALLIHGDADQLTCPQASVEFASRAGCDVKLFAGLYHEPHHEPERAEVVDYVLGWLSKRLAQDPVTAT